MPHQQVSMKTREWPWYQPWAALAFFSVLLNFVWEMVVMPAYETRSTSGAGVGIAMCVVATLGDVGITLGSYAVATMITTRRWLTRPTLVPFATYLAVGLVMTMAFEYVNVTVLHRWSYAPRMLVVAGIGVLPLLQWLVLPPIVLWLARRHLASALTVDPPREII